jgi:hypothetical protein
MRENLCSQQNAALTALAFFSPGAAMSEALLAGPFENNFSFALTPRLLLARRSQV